ncbi:amino acid adenylation domain-containing protein [Gordonia sp. DT218]|uniref:amino acid adenylation domain-containing protein n=1 Tax=Gordonia sp. DT218 TaxID=3416659 RepID=UPI003CEC1349
MEVPAVSAAPEIEDVLALSPLQEGLFVLSEMSGDGIDLYSMQFVVEITGPLDRQILHRSVDVIMERHPNLRVSLWDKDLPKPVQIVPSRVEVPWEELSATAADFDDIAAAERADRFDLRRGPSLRVKLIDLPEGRSRLLVTAHHILMDGWAIALFFQELLAIYAAGGSAQGLPAVRPYRNYIAWLAAQDGAAARAEWARYLDGVEPLMLAAPGAAATEPVRTRHELSAPATERLVAWSRSAGLTVNTAVQFAWATVLGRLTDRDDVVFGTTISGRPQGLAGADEMIGLFINTVPSRVRLAEAGGADTVTAKCIALQRESSRMRDQGYLGLSEIQRCAGLSSLFDTLFVFENAPIGAATEPISAPDGTRFLPLAMESLAHYPLTVVAYLLDGELVVMTEAIEDALGGIVPGDVAQRVVRVLEQLPDAADRHPDRLDVTLPGERALASSAAAERKLNDAVELAPTVVEAFLSQCDRTPEATALVAGARSYTYRELADHATRLAGELTEDGMVAESAVAVAIPRSAESVVAILGVLIAGGAYVPIDVSLPDQRVANIVGQAGIELVITDLAHRDRFAPLAKPLALDDPETAGRIEARPVHIAPTGLRPSSAAYIIFTSGSTGEPKGVIGTHRALVSYCRDHRDQMLAPARDRLGRPLRIAHAWTFSFDASWQPLAGLLDGHAIHLFDDDEMRDAGRLVAGLSEREIDMIDTTPSMFGQLAAAGLLGESGGGHAHLTVLALGGEAIGPALWKQLSGLPDTSAYNCYGPTETTVEAVVARIADSPSPIIGTATDRMSAHVLDSRLRPVPTGVPGELYLSGAQVTRGYQGKAALTATSFVADPDGIGERMYRTGDLVRRNARGELIFVGRSDDQVKIRGYRIETGEIEAAMRRLAGVSNAAVVVVDRAAGPALVGFAAGTDLEARGLRGALAEAIPAHMVPSRILCLPVLPMNSNGKLDSRVLAESAAESLRARSGTAVADLSATATVVRSVITDVLGSTPGVDEDFFDLGLDSIVAMAMVNALRDCDLVVTPRMVLSHPTIQDLGDAIDRAGDAVIASASGYGPVPALPVVEWMYEFGNYRRFTQTVLFALPQGLSDAGLVDILRSLIDGHDMLRSQISANGLLTREPGTVDAAAVLMTLSVDEPGDGITAAARRANDAIDPVAGRMISAVRLRCNATDDLLLLAIHHLAVDAVSWQVIFGELATAGRAIDAGDTPVLQTEYSDYRRWCEYVSGRSSRQDVLAQQSYWVSEVSGPDPAIGSRRPAPDTDTWSSLRSAVTHTGVGTTAQVLRAIDKSIGMREFLLTALTLTLATWRHRRGEDATGGAYIALEGHGREDALAGPDVDTTRTLGWFTTVFPVRLGAGRDLDIDAATSDPQAGADLLDEVAAHVGRIPSMGLDFGVLKYLSRVPELLEAPEPQVEFNYLGRFDLHTPGAQGAAGWEPWSPITDLEINEHLPTDPEPDLPLRYTLDVVAVVRATDAGPQLVTNWRYGADLLTAAEVDVLTGLWEDSVTALATALGGRMT